MFTHNFHVQLGHGNKSGARARVLWMYEALLLLLLTDSVGKMVLSKFLLSLQSWSEVIRSKIRTFKLLLLETNSVSRNFQISGVNISAQSSHNG